MTKKLIILIFILLGAVTHYQALAQDIGVKFEIEGRDVYVRLNAGIDRMERDSVLNTLGFEEAEINALHVGMRSTQNWEVSVFDASGISLRRALDSFSSTHKDTKDVQLEDLKDPVSSLNKSIASFGFRRQPLGHFTDLDEKRTKITLKGFEDAHEVYVSGNFCDWSTLKYPMTKTNNGWETTVDMNPGVWAYKFIVDGSWELDPNNKEKVHDESGYVNNRYVKANHVFELKDLDRAAKRVVVSGSFNDWHERKVVMRKEGNRWYMPVYLAEGTYSYKFILDNDEWISDPANPKTRDDGGGNINSVLSIGDPIHFAVENFQAAKSVVLSGNFNGWNTGELQMTKSAQGWHFDYVLGPGNYEYKYVVDGEWNLDPSNKVTIGKGEYENSVLVIRPNHKFKLSGYGNATDVRLSSNTVGWTHDGYTMVKDGDDWILDLHIPSGKFIYKFIVDGKWILDPTNSQREQNEFGGYNCVIWKD